MFGLDGVRGLCYHHCRQVPHPALLTRTASLFSHLQGLIQSVYELSDSSGLIITVGKYLTPRGVDIDRFGIAPDFSSLPDQGSAEEKLNACRLEAAAAAGQQQQQAAKQLQLADVTSSATG